MNNESETSYVENTQLPNPALRGDEAQLTSAPGACRGSVPPAQERLERALQCNRALIASLPASQLVDIRTDVLQAATRVLAAARSWDRLRPRLVVLVGSEARFAASSPMGWCTGWPDADPVEALVSLAEATLQAHAEYLIAVPLASQRNATFKRASELRKQFMADVRLLQQRQLLPQGALRGLRRTKGYCNVAVDLAVLVNLLEKHWQTISARCAITHDELVSAELLAQQLSAEAYDVRERAARREDATFLRARAFTLMLRAYDDLRACISLLEPRACKELAPSLYKGRGPRAASRRKTEKDVNEGRSTLTQVGEIGTAHASDEEELYSRQSFFSPYLYDEE